MNKVPPFVPNSDDDIHCVNAVFRMISQHFFGRDYTWKEIDALTHAEPGKGTWTFIAETEFAKLGLNVKNIEPLDYRRLHQEGVAYLAEMVGEDTYEYMVQRTNIQSVLKYIPEFMERVCHETRRAETREIVEYVQQNKLVAAEVNARILNNQAGLSLHFVLLYDFDGENILLHDPGSPPVASRKVSVSDFEKAFAFEGANGEATLFWK